MSTKEYGRSAWVWIALFSLYVAVYAYTHPGHNWDIIGYVGSVKELSNTHPTGLRSETYEDVRNTTSPEQFAQLIGQSNPYRAGVYSDDTAFLQQIPFYKIRIAYVAFVSVLSEFTETIGNATVAVSAISGGLFVIVSALIASDLRKEILLVLPFFLAGVGLVGLAQTSSPDALANLFALSLLGCAVRKPAVASCLSPLLLLVRTDFIILCALICLEAALRTKRISLLLPVFVAAVLLAMINHYAGNYGYLVIYNFTLIDRSLFPAEMAISTDPLEYLGAYIKGLERFLGGISLGLIFLAIRMFYDRTPHFFADVHVRLAIVTLLFVAFHFILFPAGFERFYLFVLVFVGLTVARRSLNAPQS